jgi:DNA modification methylase
MQTRYLVGDCRKTLPRLAAQSVQCVVTSPPYYGLRNYGHDAQIGLEKTPDAYVAEIVAVFREVRRVLRDDGTFWLNIGDSYGRDPAKGQHKPGAMGKQNHIYSSGGGRAASAYVGGKIKGKDLIGIPWMLAFALRADGWYLRSDIIWHKPNPMPESVIDRPTSAHEHVFLFAKSERYFYDAKAIREARVDGYTKPNGIDPSGNGGRNARNVWTIAPKPFPGAHFAVMPAALVEKCVLAGSKPGDTVLDPFAGAGTVGLVAKLTGRKAILCELSADYVAMSKTRIARVSPHGHAHPGFP